MDVRSEIRQRIDTYEATYSRFRPDSLVAQLAREAGMVKFPEDVVPLMELYERLYELTGGRVTPLIGGALEAAGYDANYSFQARQQQVTPDLKTVLKRERTCLTTTIPLTLDVGAAGKGYLVDIVAGILDRAKIPGYVIDASGDVLHKGGSENRVGLEHPRNPSMVIGVVDVRNRSLCASAINRRAWGDGMHHIFDPHTQAPVRGVIATWVIAKTALVADGLATTLFFTEPEELGQVYEFEYVRMFEDGSLDYSANFSGELFL
jgi:thiamine biosynthesis lipoprotein